MNAIEIGQRVITCEARALDRISKNLGKPFLDMLDVIMSCEGKVIVIGMGKSGHVARKIAASMASLGTCSICLHPGECLHGDLGMIQKGDVVFLISHSGESEEIIRIIPSIRIIGARIIGLTSNAESTLARLCDVVQVLDGLVEACHMGLAPTTSTTATMAFGDALAVAASEIRGFDKNDFAVFHPAGSLGKSLTLKAADLMRPIHEDALVDSDSTLADAVFAIVESKADILLVVDQEGRFAGVVTSDDIKLAILGGADIREECIASMVNQYPHFADASTLAIDVLRAATEANVDSVPVVRGDLPIGVITRADIMKAGIYI